MMWPRSTEDCRSPQDLGRGVGQTFPPAPEGTNPAATLDLGFWPPGLGEKNLSYLNHPACGHLSQQPQDTTTCWPRGPCCWLLGLAGGCRTVRIEGEPGPQTWSCRISELDGGLVFPHSRAMFTFSSPELRSQDRQEAERALGGLSTSHSFKG